MNFAFALAGTGELADTGKAFKKALRGVQQT